MRTLTILALTALLAGCTGDRIKNSMNTPDARLGTGVANPTGMMVIDAGSRIVLVNTEAERLFGYHRGELVGKRIKMFASSVTAAGADLHILRKDGTELPVETT